MAKTAKWSEQDLLDAEGRMKKGGALVPELKVKVLAAGLMSAPEKDLRGASAGLNPSPVSTPAPSSKFDSAWEEEYARQLAFDRQAGLIRDFWYHPFTLHLPGKVKYAPDFLIQYPDGLERKLKIVEVKGWSRNRRDGVTRYKIAAGIYECFDWEMIEKQRSKWVAIG